MADQQNEFLIPFRWYRHAFFRLVSTSGSGTQTEVKRMTAKDNSCKQYRIYDKGTHTWIDVPEDQYRKFDRRRTALRKRMQYHHCCKCPKDKFWLCDCLCDDCEFRTGAVISLDAPLPGENGTIGDLVADDHPIPEEIASDRALLECLINRLREIDPEANTIIQIWLDHPKGISDRQVAALLGRAASTFRDEMRFFRSEARKLRGDDI
jgi:hypothetical protein